VTLRLLTWNLFHGRDHPPDPALFTWRSRLLRVTERDERFEQVNRPLRAEFTTVLRRFEWDVALLQEAPPRWSRHLRAELAAGGALALTSRNSLAPLRALAAWLNPDLVASNEGGSNQVLVRAPWRIAESRCHTLTERPERRRMLWTRVAAADGRELAVANVHGSVDSVPGAGAQVLEAARVAVAWARDLPLVFGGDLNLRPSRQPQVFDELDAAFGLAPPTARHAIDHLLVRGLELLDAPHALPDAVRQVRVGGGRVLQLSDHACVAATASMR
jgi:endonuclease/exonuclease/phosphatase family metal-dependent hydrolase